ncbi:MAG TPA: DUF6155 family protein [Sphingobacteriaceae bacterium]|nr:DUF6155 family protein [Sphingobacteriaceae bacterium]
MTLKKYLSQFSKEQLISQILELDKKYKDVKAYYEFSINPDLSLKSKEVKFVLYDCFFPRRGYKLRLKDARKAISDFKKLGPTPEALVDVMLYYVECGVEYANTFGDIDEPFYNSIASMFADTGKLVQANDLEKTVKERVEKILGNCNGIGWGFEDEITDIYYNFFDLDKV